MNERSDDALPAAPRAEPEAFAVFYRRHVEALLAYFARRTRDAELAADLTAETFAAALGGAQCVFEITFEREGTEKPVCVAESVVRVYEGGPAGG